MGSDQTRSRLPVIDFSDENLKPGTSSWLSICKEVRAALEEHSCFLVQYPAITEEIRSAIFQVSQQLFDLPTETKQKVNSNTDKLIGYIGESPHNPTYEGLVVDDDAHGPEAVAKLTALMWPSGNERFRETVESYKQQVSKLEKLVMGVVFECLGVKEFYGHYYEAYTDIVGFNKHRSPEMSEKLGGVEEHTDPTFITLIHQNPKDSSFEVKSKQDGCWIAVQLPASSFLVMASDALLAWSNGRIHPTLHRVKMSPGETRLSIAVASFCNGVIQVPEQLVDDDKHPLQFKPFNHLGFLHHTFKNPNLLKDEGKIKAYCGV